MGLSAGIVQAETRTERTQTYQETTRSENGVVTTTTRSSESSSAGAPAALPWQKTAAASSTTTTTITRNSPPSAIYGYELMTEKEREEFFDDLDDADDDAERAGIMAEHRARMEQRARTMGVTIAEPNAESTTTTTIRRD
jgi:hypothetical protein